VPEGEGSRGNMSPCVVEVICGAAGSSVSSSDGTNSLIDGDDTADPRQRNCSGRIGEHQPEPRISSDPPRIDASERGRADGWTTMRTSGDQRQQHRTLITDTSLLGIGDKTTRNQTTNDDDVLSDHAPAEPREVPYVVHPMAPGVCVTE